MKHPGPQLPTVGSSPAPHGPPQQGMSPSRSPPLGSNLQTSPSSRLTQGSSSAAVLTHPSPTLPSLISLFDNTTFGPGSDPDLLVNDTINTTVGGTEASLNNDQHFIIIHLRSMFPLLSPSPVSPVSPLCRSPRACRTVSSWRRRTFTSVCCSPLKLWFSCWSTPSLVL